MLELDAGWLCSSSHAVAVTMLTIQWVSRFYLGWMAAPASVCTLVSIAPVPRVPLEEHRLCCSGAVEFMIV